MSLLLPNVTSGIDKDRWMDGKVIQWMVVRSRVVLRVTREKERERKERKRRKVWEAVKRGGRNEES